MRARKLLPVLATAAVALGACGGGDESTPEEYRADARSICVEADRATEGVEQPNRSTPAAIADYFRRLLAPNERAVRRFEELDPPEELQDAHDEALAANRRGADAVRRVIRQLEAGEDPQQVLTSAQGEIRRLTQQADQAAERLGVPECGD